MAAPVGVAQALPGLHTGAVHAARVGDALVTVLALPAIQTTVRHKRATHRVIIGPETRRTCRRFKHHWRKTVKTTRGSSCKR